MVKVENVTKKYGGFTAVDNISFEIQDGEIVGFLGKNGAGKSTTMNMITGCIEATEGEIEINGYNISRKPKKAKREIGYMPEGVPLYYDMTVKEFVNYMADLKGLKKKEKKEEVKKVIKETGLDSVQNTLNRNLSRGYKQRVSMAGALVGNPKVLILDEPTVGLDPQQVKQIRELIKNLGKNHTVFISSHILSEISQICDKVIIIDNGKIVAIDTPDNIENRATENNVLDITVEDENNKAEEVAREIKGIKEIKLVNQNTDGTKHYMILVEKDKDIRKDIFEKFAQNNIIIIEIKKSDVTLEDAFLKLTNNTTTEKHEEEKKENENITVENAEKNTEEDKKEKNEENEQKEQKEDKE